MWYKPEILNKYGIDHKGPRETVLKQVEKAYRELDARFCRMTARSRMRTSCSANPQPRKRYRHKGRHPKATPERPVCTSVEAEGRVFDGKGNLFRKTKLKKTRK